MDISLGKLDFPERRTNNERAKNREKAPGTLLEAEHRPGSRLMIWSSDGWKIHQRLSIQSQGSRLQ